jgi:serine/threonine protein kinase/tetratricopeptide (TPR) repeat protein
VSPISKDIRKAVTETLQAPVAELATGSTFAGRYQIIEELGRGGMGKVYRVLDMKLNEEVALKLIRPEVASDKQTIERFNSELKMARKIAHRNVGKMYELMEAEGTHFITMEYVPGQDLRGLIRQVGRLTTGKAVSIARQICEGLEEAHRLGVVHRDLKPGNILIDKDGNARIMDFGIARSLRGKGITRAGVMIGTPEYMSPEQVEGKGIDQRSDIYSLGVVLYEMVTGRRPFEGETPLSVAHKQKYAAPEDPKKLNAQVPDEMSRVILRCLEKDKEKRYQSADELHSELTRLEKEIPTKERTTPKRKPTKSREMAVGKSKVRWAKIGLYAGAVVVLGLIVYAGFHFSAGRHEIIDSIAVLPFENVNADPNTDYLCDGITETIINKLSQLSGLKKVIARNSVFTYKGKTVDAKQVGRELGVNTVLLTRMARLGDRLTISPTLVRAKDNSQIWGERYDRKFEDIFAIEENIATSIVQALRLKLTPEDRQKIEERPIDNPSAYEWYLWVDYEIGRFKLGSLDRAVKALENALEASGPSPLLYTAMARAYRGYVNIGAQQETYIAKAEEYAQKALAIDPKFSGAHSVLAFLYCFKDVREAIRQYRTALALNPNDSNALFGLVMLYQDSGKLSTAGPLIERYKQVNPLDPGNFTIQGFSSLYDGQFDQALTSFRKWYQSDPENPAAAFYYALGLAYNKELDETFSIIDQCVEAEPDNLLTSFALLLKYGLQKDKERAFQLVTPDFKKTCWRDLEWSYNVAQAFALLDEKKEALDWLENAVDRGFINYPFISQHDTFLDNVRGEERFKKLMERVKFEWEHFEE